MTPFAVNNIYPLNSPSSSNGVSPLRFGKLFSSSPSSQALSSVLMDSDSPVAIADLSGQSNTAVMGKMLMALTDFLFPEGALPVFMQEVVKTAGGDIAVYTPIKTGLSADVLDFKA